MSDRSLSLQRTCIGCGATVPPNKNSCPMCTAPFESDDSADKSTRQAETVFYNLAGIVVTSARLVTPGQTFAMGNVTSVRSESDKQSRSIPLVVAVVAFVLGGMIYPVIGPIAAIAAGYYFWNYHKPDHRIVVVSAAGESPAITSKDIETIHIIHQAISSAIISRG